jgi:uncharacterized C2H2 Zn-finger protein
MHHIIAAIKSGTDPVAPLPQGAFTRQLDELIYCPKCSVYYLLHADYEASVNKFFEQETRRHLSLLKKAVMMGHDVGHRVTHFETNGVTVERHAAAKVVLPPVPKRVM